MTGIALMESEIPSGILPAYPKRIFEREGRREVQFHWWQKPTVLPVIWKGQLQLHSWGNRDRRSRLPMGGWIPEAQLQSGVFSECELEDVFIPANLGFHHGVWFMVNEGFRGIIFPRDAIVYLLSRPSTNYYRNMTQQAAMMPILVNQVI
jgi:nitrate reductase gamma subunit